jgi:DNA-directed RNA polymerase subunit beta'
MIIDNFKAIRLKLASPEQILSWSYGEVLKPETINYRTQRAEKDGLFSERIFGPTKNWECYCGKYRRVRYKGVVCEKCGVEVTRSDVRRERMGHIQLAAPVAHIWFLRNIPSRIGMFLGVPSQQLEKVVYYTAYIITSVNEEKKKEVLNELEGEYRQKKGEVDVEKLYKEQKEEINEIVPLKVISEAKYFELSRKFGHIFEAGIGGEAVKEILEKIDLKKLEESLNKKLALVKNALEKRKMLSFLKMVKSFIKNNMRPEWMFLSVLPVLPPGLRPIVPLDGGRFATSDSNDLYRRVINRNNRLKKLLELKAPSVIVRNEKRMLQEAVDALIDNSIRQTQTQMTVQKRPLKSLADILGGKQGRFRQNLLGKRVDYSGRSVIVVGPELKHYECGLPKKMALELFRPFVVHNLIEKELANTFRNANRFIDQMSSEVWEALEEVIKDKVVLLNRAPTLHRLGIQAFKPILVEGLAIKIPPMVCPAFNADFDGDQMPVHVPLSNEAQKEAKEKMLSSNNFLKPSSGSPIVNPTQDILLGCFYLTQIVEDNKKEEELKHFSSVEEVKYAYEFGNISLKERIKVFNPKKSIVKLEIGEIKVVESKNEIIETSLGRIIFNEVFPENFPYFNEITDNKFLKKVISFIGMNLSSSSEMVDVIDKIKTMGFLYAMKSGMTLGLGDLQIPKVKKEIIEKSWKEVEEIEGQYQEGLLSRDEKKAHIVQVWLAAESEIEKSLRQGVDIYGPVSSFVDSGARGSWKQIKQMTGMRGLVQNPKGELIEMPIKSSYKEGFNILEYFIASHGARKGATDTALKTADAGYLTRKLVEVTQDVVIIEDDCKTNKGILIERKEEVAYDNFADRLFSRTLLEPVKIGNEVVLNKNEIIDKRIAKIIEAEKSIKSVKVRSPITCESIWGICSKCYGYDLAYNKPVEIGVPVGVVAAQSIGEPGTQLTLRTFHTGGIAGKDITHGLPRITELFEARTPNYKATISSVKGEIAGIEKKETEILIDLIPEKKEESKKKTKKKEKIDLITYSLLPDSKLLVRKGDKVKAGQPLSVGSIDPDELMKIAGKEEVEKYIMDEIQKVYISQGVGINNKHLEILLRQMFSKIKIIKSGETDFMVGETVSNSLFTEKNRKAKEKGLKVAEGEVQLMSITKASLASDSFLAASSFQNTTKIMVGAATEGKIDYLRGIKENVMIGRLISAGTGFRKIQTEDFEDE